MGSNGPSIANNNYIRETIEHINSAILSLKSIDKTVHAILELSGVECKLRDQIEFLKWQIILGKKLNLLRKVEENGEM